MLEERYVYAYQEPMKESSRIHLVSKINSMRTFHKLYLLGLQNRATCIIQRVMPILLQLKKLKRLTNRKPCKPMQMLLMDVMPHKTKKILTSLSN